MQAVAVVVAAAATAVAEAVPAATKDVQVTAVAMARQISCYLRYVALNANARMLL